MNRIVNPQDVVKIFGPIWAMSAAQGMFEEGYWYHRALRPLWRGGFDDLTFVGKTMTLHGRAGNTETLPDGYRPLHLFPKSVAFSLRWRHWGSVVNSWGLSNPGARALLDERKWQNRTGPTMLSFMSVAGTREERIEEVRAFAGVLREYRGEFPGVGIGLQYNLSCPNAGIDPNVLVAEGAEGLDALAEVDMPIFVKVSVVMPNTAIAEISHHPNCSGIVTSNTVPWGKVPDRIPWKDIFGTEESPLIARGLPNGGGLSGPHLYPLVREQVEELRKLGVIKHINAGGGVNHWAQVTQLADAGADSVSIGTGAVFFPWRLKRVVREARRVFGS